MARTTSFNLGVRPVGLNLGRTTRFRIKAGTNDKIDPKLTYDSGRYVVFAATEPRRYRREKDGEG
jgi:hypothetical protein